MTTLICGSSHCAPLRGMLNNNEEDKVVFKKRHTDFEGPIKNPIPHQEHLPALESQDPFKQKS